MQVPEKVEVQYKFLSRFRIFQSDEVYTGTLEDINREQAVVEGRIPDTRWIEPLREGKILVGLNIFLPTESVPIKVLTTVTKVEDSPSGVHYIALNFREISDDHHRRIIKFIVGLYIKRGGT